MDGDVESVLLEISQVLNDLCDLAEEALQNEGCDKDVLEHVISLLEDVASEINDMVWEMR